MNILKAKRIRHFLRLSYPLRVIANDDGFSGDYPDLPGCAVMGADLSMLYQQLESRRREWITEHVLMGENVPMPNSHLVPGDKSASGSGSGDDQTSDLSVSRPSPLDI